MRARPSPSVRPPSPASLMLCGLVGAIFLFAASSTAPAAFPGTNGKIAFGDVAGVAVMDPDGRNVTRFAGGFSPAWSPDGTKLAVVRRTEGPCAPCSNAIDLKTFTADTTTVFQPVTFDPAPSWSPDGAKLVFTHQSEAGADDLFTINADGSGLTRLTRTGANFHPAWSPDGERVAFDSFDSEGVHIYVMNRDGSGRTQLTFGRTFDLRPNWSPDGRRIAFESERAGSFEIYTMNADGSGVDRLTSGSSPSNCFVSCPVFPLFNPAWSPDGTRIVFASSREGSDQIYVMNADGSAQTRVGAGADPDWQPTVDLVVSQTAPKTARVGSKFTITGRLSNRSPVAARGVRFIARLPRQLRLVAARTSAGACVGSATVTCSVDGLAAGETMTVLLNVRATAAGRATNRVEGVAAQFDPTPASNVARAQILVRRRR